MASPATKSASLASLLLLMVSLAAQPSSQQRQDQLTDLSLQPAPRMIAASWRLLNLSGRVGAFLVKWENVKGSGEKELHRCTVPYLVSDSQQHSTEQCDETPMLLPGTEYNVSLWKLNHGSRPLSSPLQISGRTLPEDHVANRLLLPDQLIVLSLRPTSHMIAASWHLLNASGQVASFRVEWWKDEGFEQEHHRCTVQHRESESQQYSTEQCDQTPRLRPCTKYIVVVIGMNDQSQVITARRETYGYTEPGVASLAVTHLADNILVQWTLDQSCKALHHYVVEWSNEAEGIDNGYVYSKSAKNNTLHYIMDSPKPCRVYNLTVSPRNKEDSIIGPSSSIMVNTPARVTNLTAASVGGRSVALSWRRSDTPCDVTEYYINFEGEAVWGVRQRHSGSVGVEHEGVAKSNYHFNLTDMVPLSVYNVCVTAATQDGNGATICVKDVHTDEIEPSAPTSFTLQSSAHNITATWQEPTEHNGVLGPYNVSWKCGANTSKELVSTRAYTIKGLPACVECTVKVTASTGLGEGESSEATARTLPEAPDSVTLLKSRMAGARSVALWWKRPVTLCNIISYYITYDGKTMWGEKNPHSGSVVAQENPVQTTYFFNLIGLVPHAQYNVCVAAGNHLGNSSVQCLEVLQTKQARPSTPSTFSVVSSGDTLMATWQVPQEPNGELGPYNISWQCGAYTSYKLINTTAYTIKGLPAGVECRVKVAASTEAGEGDNSEESVWIQSEVKGPPVPQTDAARWVAPTVGGAVAVLVTAAIVGGVILWRRGQTRKTLGQRSTDKAVAETSPTTATTLALTALPNGNDREESTIAEAGEASQFLNAPLPFPPLPPLPVEKKTDFSDRESLSEHYYDSPLTEDLRRAIVDETVPLMVGPEKGKNGKQENLMSFVDALTQSIAARTNFSSDEMEVIRIDIRKRTRQFFYEAGNESDGFQIHPGRGASIVDPEFCFSQITTSIVEKLLAETSWPNTEQIRSSNSSPGDDFRMVWHV